MSMHEIEGLVENSVHLVAKSKMPATIKRDFLYNLYRFQSMFDTGYTHFRLIDILLKLKFTYRIPIEKHPDYKNNKSSFNGLDIEKNHWFPSEIGIESKFVYAQKETDGIFLYADAGSDFWHRLCEEKILPKTEHQAPKEFKTGELIAKLLQEFDIQKDNELVSDWYALLINLLGVELGKEEGFLEQFTDFIKQHEIQEIKQIASKYKLFTKKRKNDGQGVLATPNLKEIDDFETDIDCLYCKKWLLDFKTDNRKLIAAYTKAITPDPKLEKKIQLIPNAIAHHLDQNYWKLVWEEANDNGYKWLYHHQLRGEPGNNVDTDLHLYFLLDMKTDLKILYPKVGVQNGLLLRWQDRKVIHNPVSVHFLDAFIFFIDEKEWDFNKNLDNMGGWKFNIKQSEKTLKKHLDNLFDCFKKYNDKVWPEFEKPLFTNFQMTIEEALEYREKIQYTHRFFLNSIEVYLVYAMHHFEKEDREKAYELAEKIKQLAKEKTHPIAKEWITSADSILENKPKLNELLSL